MLKHHVSIAAAALVLLVLATSGNAASGTARDRWTRQRPHASRLASSPAVPQLSGTVGPGTVNKSKVVWSTNPFVAPDDDLIYQMHQTSITKSVSGPILVTLSAESADTDPANAAPCATVTINNVEMNPAGDVIFPVDGTTGAFTWVQNRGAGTYTVRVFAGECDNSPDGTVDATYYFRSVNVQFA